MRRAKWQYVASGITALAGTAWALYRFTDWLPKVNKMSISSHAEKQGVINDIPTMTKEELYQMAQERDIEGRSAMSKAELVDALEHEHGRNTIEA